MSKYADSYIYYFTAKCSFTPDPSEFWGSFNSEFRVVASDLGRGKNASFFVTGWRCIMFSDESVEDVIMVTLALMGGDVTHFSYSGVGMPHIDAIYCLAARQLSMQPERRNEAVCGMQDMQNPFIGVPPEKIRAAKYVAGYYKS